MMVVLDTNIVASATFWRAKPAHCEMFIECAAQARADYLVTGDKGHLLALKQAAGIPIVAVSVFLRIIGVPEKPS